MRPFFATHDLVDGASIKAVSLGQHFYASAFGVKPPNFTHILCCQFGIISVLTTLWTTWAAPCLVSLANFIRSIGCSCAKKKVVRAHTGAVVAMVADEKTGRDWSEVQFPRVTMSHDALSINLEPSVSVAPICALIGPTTRRPSHIAPEPLLRKSIASGIRASAAAKARSTSAIMAWVRMILCGAVEADSRYAAPSSHRRKITQIAHARQGWAT